ncbi:serine hydrolase domain-containing protein [Variovorax sp. VNK109]|uniref:serine hydrolase domain-containing protein n=1 Tax=Variovorax sp. VNK109 TaxID=3400919 RepID=UPI003C04D006
MLDNILRDPLVASHIPGISIATLRAGEIGEVLSVGRRSTGDSLPVDVHTVFEAASLTKPVVAFVALQLAEEGHLDLHAPLQGLCGEYVQDDTRSAAITALHVLTHTSGLPNIVTGKTPLKIYFTPGERFNYGSSAFAWLQRAIEHVTGQPLEEVVRARVLAPLGMADSSLQWQARFDANHAIGHDMLGQPMPKRRLTTAAASWSLQTTATDYARFVQAVLRGWGLSAAMHARWLTPCVVAREGVDDVLNADAKAFDGIAWGLGWGLDTGAQSFFHWGNSPGFRAYVVGNMRTKDAVVWFANSARGLRLARRILPAVFPAAPVAFRSMDWLQIGATLDED